MNTRSMAVCLVAMAMAAAGCKETKDEHLQTRLDDLSRGQSELLARVTELEAENQALQLKLQESRLAMVPAVAGAAQTNAATLPVSSVLTPEIAEALAGTVNNLLNAGLDARIDARIAAQVGTARDIEAYFVQAVGEELEAREQREREEREQRQQEFRDRRQREQVDEMSKVVGLDENQKEQVFALYTNMQSQVRRTMAELFERGNVDREAFQKAREEIEQSYQSELRGVLSTAQFEKYETDWRSNVTNRMSRFFRPSGSPDGGTGDRRGGRRGGGR